jgi:deoxyribodipyrimidine photo-lyase
MTPTILWLRRDLRLTDHPALTAAVARGGPVIPVFILDDLVGGWGAAPRWRLGASLAELAKCLTEKGSRLILRRGPALAVLRDLAAETGAGAVFWSRLYDAPSIERDAEVKQALREAGVAVESFNGSLLFEPWTVQTGGGGFYKVYTPFWKTVSGRDPGAPVPAPGRIPAPDAWPTSDAPADWGLGCAMRRGAAVVARHATVGEAAATARLDAFIARGVRRYADLRDRLDLDGTSGLSENLATGELSPRTAWAAAAAIAGEGAETFRKELVWRDFAYHLLYHTPRLATDNWKPEWDAFPWRGDNDDAERWRRGMTGEPVIDAAMRQLYVTGRMHNRARMLVASYLCKHLMTHWKVGEAWFRETLTDWDVASNAMGWQWAAGSGPDAAPFFRIFNPATQADRFDPDGAYRKRWIAEGRVSPATEALSYFDAIPESWALSPRGRYPAPLVDLKNGRENALAAYEALRRGA